MQFAPRARFGQLVERLDANERAMRQATISLLQTIAELDQGRDWSEDDETSLSCFLADRLRLRAASAVELVRIARKLRSLPRIRAVALEGDLSFDQLRPLTRFATEETDEQLSIEGPAMTVPQLYREALRHERARREEAESDRQLRHLRMTWGEDRRFLYLDGCLPAEQGARVEAALEARAKDIVLEDGPLLDRQGARLADALTELVTSDAGGVASTTVVVHADAKVLTGAGDAGPSHLAETENGIQFPDEAVRRVACDARIEWILERDGRAVGIGRRGRLVRGALARALRHRDAGMCAFPGCERRRWVEAHHLVHWAQGGSTDLDNLVLLCGTHHHFLHEGGWRTSGVPGRDLRFHDPGGGSRPHRMSPPHRAVA